MMVYGRLLMRSGWPTTSRDPANRVCHSPYPIITTRDGVGPSSSLVKVRPSRGRMPNVFGKSYVTASPSTRSAPDASARLTLVSLHSDMLSNALARSRHV